MKILFMELDDRPGNREIDWPQLSGGIGVRARGTREKF
jgi:hypothetical protein